MHSADWRESMHVFRKNGAYFAAAASLSIGLSQLYAQPPASLEALRAAWSNRQTQIRSLKITWQEEEFHPKGLLTGRIPGETGTIPPQDDTLSGLVSSLVLAGPSSRYTGQRGNWSGAENRYVAQNIVESFHDGEGRSLTPQGSSTSRHPQGLTTTFRPSAMGMNKVLPIWLAVRPLHPDYRVFDLDTMQFTGRRAVVQQKQCYELARAQGKTLLSVWVDPSQDYSVLRLVDTSNGKISRKIDTRCRKIEGIFLPDSWDQVSLDKSGDMTFAAHATVTQVEVNPEVDDREIPVVYPDGAVMARVKDGGQKLSVIVPGGNERPILPDDYSLSYDELLKKKSSFAYTLGLSRRAFWCIVACIVVPIGVFIWRKRPLILSRRS
jgi:hypothetical protein